MKKCNSCNVYISDTVDNCPICGAVCGATATSEFNWAPYPEKDSKQNPKLVRKIFLASSIIVAFIGTILGFILSQPVIIYATLGVVGFAWINVLQYVFKFSDTKQIMLGNAFWLSVYSFIYTLSTLHLDWQYAIIVPILLVILNITFMMIVFITGKWYIYACSVFCVSLLELINLIVCFACSFNLIIALPVAIVGLSTLLFALIFGKKVLITEIRKRLFL